MLQKIKNKIKKFIIKKLSKEDKAEIAIEYLVSLDGFILNVFNDKYEIRTLNFKRGMEEEIAYYLSETYTLPVCKDILKNIEESEIDFDIKLLNESFDYFLSEKVLSLFKTNNINTDIINKKNDEKFSDEPIIKPSNIYPTVTTEIK